MKTARQTIFSKVMAVFLLLGTGSVSAATLTPSGATGVNVNGTLYDVEFKDIACSELWTDCGALNGIPFTFSSLRETYDASVALYHVIRDAGQHNSPVYIDGCERLSHCAIATPYKVVDGRKHDKVFSGALWIRVVRDGFSFLKTNVDKSADNIKKFVYADWQLTAVPLPGAAWLFLSGLFGFIAFNRKRKSNS